jgi:transposase
MQFAENLSDRQAAEAVRARIDWKYALGLELTDEGFHYSVLSEFRTRLVQGSLEQVLLDTLLTCCQARGWLKARGRQRTDSTHVLVVMHFEQRSAVEGSPVSLLVAFSHDSDDAEAGVSEETWWRIIFRHVPAFRFRHLDNAPASPPFVRPRPGEPLDVAIWEVVHSQWLPEVVGSGYSSPNSVHHYVLASWYVIYEIAAEE